MNIADLKIDDKTFKLRYLETAIKHDDDKITQFWNDCNPNPRGLIQGRQYLLLRDRMFGLLEACKRIDSDAFKNIHKGHPFYFIGITSYLLGDFQTAIYFFDAAVTEDLGVGAEPKTNPKPSTRFLMLEGDSIEQAAQALVKDTQQKVERAIKYYNEELYKHPSIPIITLEIVRDYFIYPSLISNDQGLRTLVTAFITFFIEWDSRNKYFDLDVGRGTSEPFFLHLFRGCLLFESLVKLNQKGIKPSKPDTNLGRFLNEIHNDLYIDQQSYGRATLKETIKDLQNDDNSIQKAIHYTGRVRNTVGHNLGWNESLSKDQYQTLYFKIAASCLHAIACLWKL